MIELGFVWIYLAFLCISFGGATMGLLHKKLQIDSSHIFKNMFVGWCITTVICEYISVFCAINSWVVIALAILAIIIDIIYLLLKREKWNWPEYIRTGKYTAILLFALLLIAYMSVSTYIAPIKNPADTFGYHVQAVKWIEDFGCVKGIANLISRLGFNNSVWCFYALGTMKGVITTRMHCALGFILALAGCYFIERLVQDVNKLFSTKVDESNKLDGFLVSEIIFEIAAIVYVINNAVAGNEFFTDQPANVLVAFILLEWISETKDSENSVSRMALLSVLIVFLSTIKLSMAVFVLIALWPIVIFIKHKDVKSLAMFGGMGFFMGLPFVIRNIIITGRFVYPSTALDVFKFSWKIPTPIVNIEKNLIYSFARDGSYSVERVWDKFDYSWILPWFKNASIVDVFLVLLNLFCIVIVLIVTAQRVGKKNGCVSMSTQQLVVFGGCSVCFLYWFLSAPDSRFIKTVLVFFPICICVKLFLDFSKNSEIARSKRIVIVFFCVAELVCSKALVEVITYLNSTDNISYLLTSTQPEFEEFEDEVYELGGNTIYFAESPSDHELPCMSQLTKIEDIQLIGNDFSDGFVFVEDEKRK